MPDTKLNLKADMKAGTVYAILGEGGWYYCGQVTGDRQLGVFRWRDREPPSPSAVLQASIMSVFTVALPSVTRALRAGTWQKLGRFPVVQALLAPRSNVMWGPRTATVTVWRNGAPTTVLRCDDTAVQELEVMAAWDAQVHVPARLTADFGLEPPLWHVGGPVWRERRVREEYARRFPDAPHHRLPADWPAAP